MKYKAFIFGAMAAVAWSTLTCGGNASPQADRMLAERTCGHCHQFPEPALLDKATWKNSVLPEMAFYMGHRPLAEFLKKGSQAGFFAQAVAKEVIPEKPLLSANEWERLQDFYLKNAPDKLPAASPLPTRPLEELFRLTPIRSTKGGNITSLSYDTTLQRFLIGNRFSQFGLYQTDGKPDKVWQLNGVPSWVGYEPKTNQFRVVLMGDMEPHNLPIGTIAVLDASSAYSRPIPQIINLYRPTHVSEADFNADGRPDYVVSSFGYIVGNLSWYEGLPNEQFAEHILLPKAGAVKTFIVDANRDNRPDILALMAQGDESIYLFENQGNNSFLKKRLLRFPPVYGTTDMALADMNADGHADLIIAAGDNGDYSPIPKPYHGIRIFLNDGHFNFSEKNFIPINGATTVQVADFDSDGHPDISVGAYYADFARHTAGGFTLLKNLGNSHYTAYQSEATAAGHWWVQTLADTDRDGRPEIYLGNILDTPMPMPPALKARWEQEKILLLKLESK